MTQPQGCFHAARGFYLECDLYPECACDNIVASSQPQARGEDGLKDESDIIDPKSTGRKRAARMFPRDASADCEWLGKKFLLESDGELFVGCNNGKQDAIHHGPNKDTLVNEVGNVWRVCTRCHNRYHTLIDPTYDWNREEFFPITLAEATVEEQAASEIMWMGRKVKAGDRSVNPND